MHSDLLFDMLFAMVYAKLLKMVLQKPWASEGIFSLRDFRDFSKIFPGDAKSGEICFFPLKTKKTTFFY